MQVEDGTVITADGRAFPVIVSRQELKNPNDVVGVADAIHQATIRNQRLLNGGKHAFVGTRSGVELSRIR